jgi:hypothetical protein
MSDVLREDVFSRLVAEDASWLSDQWNAIMGELRTLEAEQRELNIRRERLEARRAVLDGIAQLRKVELVGEDEALPESRPLRAPKDVCLAIMREANSTEWTAPELHRPLEERGVKTSASNVRMVLRRLVDEGSLHHVARGRYSAQPR